jgi:glycosyltransferase involved in cell wall biosynthesis
MSLNILEKVTIVIPTLNRGSILIDTIDYLRKLSHSVSIIAVDQTLHHPEDIQNSLESYQENGSFQWIRLTQPSVVAAMNQGLLAANTEFVLFLDDDIKPFSTLLTAHSETIAHTQGNVGVIAGRVVESWDDPEGITSNNENHFSFNGLNDCLATVFRGGNFSVNRALAIKLGGFDENFRGTAHDYEREFADRITASKSSIRYCAAAGVHHLKVKEGGIRTYGHFLKTAKPHHAVGAYYYILTSRLVSNKPFKIIQRMIERVATKTHLKQPWWIPLTLIGDIVGLLWAIKMWIQGPVHISPASSSQSV